jgi:hypothetical protein
MGWVEHVRQPAEPCQGVGFQRAALTLQLRFDMALRNAQLKAQCQLTPFADCWSKISPVEVIGGHTAALRYFGVPDVRTRPTVRDFAKNLTSTLVALVRRARYSRYCVRQVFRARPSGPVCRVRLRQGCMPQGINFCSTSVRTSGAPYRDEAGKSWLLGRDEPPGSRRILRYREFLATP